ncbi:MAG TPA: hypothetical protein VIJ47_12365 [Acidimicrobiales bacterium]
MRFMLLQNYGEVESEGARLLEMRGEPAAAIVEFRAAATRATNQREQQFLLTQAARLSAGLDA